jgi:AraC family transcriptional regulator
MESKWRKAMEDYISDVFFESLPDLTVASAVVISENPEEEVMAFLDKWVKEHPGLKCGRKFGFDVPVSKDQRERGLRGYEYWIAITGAAKITNGVTIKTIPGAKYAAVRVTDPFSDPFTRIGRGWGRLVEWIKANALPEEGAQGVRYSLEEVKEIDGVTVMDLYMAIE